MLIDRPASELEEQKNIYSLGVVNDQNKITGMVLRGDLFNILGKKYGRDVYKYAPHKQLIVLCDVSGKGISASLISAVMGGMLSIYDFQKNSIEKFIKDLNSYIYTTFKLEKMVTGLF